MGGRSSCPICPSEGAESNHSTTVSLFAFSWTSWHAQSLSVGLLLGVTIVVILIALCGTRYIHCLLPRKYKQRRTHSNNRRGTNYEQRHEPRNYDKNVSTCSAVSLPLQHTRCSAPMEPPFRPHSTPAPQTPGFDSEAIRRLELQFSPPTQCTH